ncbi:competence protein ComK [Bacillus sp. FJAT-29790]|uniref:competence protein ComK n=1 Tax=Bacillus sp. FJAT-29790 TaxID=1895002 RepID=UPI001C23DA1D|nr:competence protein ComK [Bacillus sp. FJAT-29790]MBU8877403.1 competence protein ComK [Bacillus sp. FJAT-29790]
MKSPTTTPLIEEYEINPNTMIIKPVSYGSKIYSQIWELEDEVLSPFKPIEIIKKSCRYFGSSYEGRKEGTRQLTGITHKAPITIDPTNFIYFFPTSSASNAQCIWISLEHILYHRRADAGNTQVIFKNKECHIIPISYNSFNNQLLRTALLKTTLNSRLEESERKALYFFSGKRHMNASERAGTYRIGGRE